MRIRMYSLLVMLFAFLTAVHAEQDVIGEVVFFDGDFTLYRDNQELAGLSFGDKIENMDQIVTSGNATVEIALYPETGISASIVVGSDTVMYFDISGLRQEQHGALELLSGRLDLKVARLSGDNELDIRTGSAVMGVRGTEFSVTTSLAGDVLLFTSEGRVECRTASNQVFFSVPGEVVEKTADVRWQNLTVSDDGQAGFVTNWAAERNAALSANAVKVLSVYAKDYLELKENFIQAYVRLMNNRDVIQKWIDEDRLDRVGSVADRLREKRQIIGSLMNIRANLFFFERVYYRLKLLTRRFPDLPGNTELAPGLSVRNFYRQFNQDSEVIDRRMREIRYILKLYALRNDGTTPFENFFSADIRSGSIFDDPENFFSN